MSSEGAKSVNASTRLSYERFVVSVDGQAKSSFAKVEDAQKEADRIATGYPKVIVRILDGTRRLVREYPDEPQVEALPDSAD